MATIKKLKESNNTIYPITDASAVWVNDQEKLSTILAPLGSDLTDRISNLIKGQETIQKISPQIITSENCRASFSAYKINDKDWFTIFFNGIRGPHTFSSSSYIHEDDNGIQTTYNKPIVIQNPIYTAFRQIESQDVLYPIQNNLNKTFYCDTPTFIEKGDLNLSYLSIKNNPLEIKVTGSVNQAKDAILNGSIYYDGEPLDLSTCVWENL